MNLKDAPLDRNPCEVADRVVTALNAMCIYIASSEQLHKHADWSQCEAEREWLKRVYQIAEVAWWACPARDEYREKFGVHITEARDTLARWTKGEGKWKKTFKSS